MASNLVGMASTLVAILVASSPKRGKAKEACESWFKKEGLCFAFALSRAVVQAESWLDGRHQTKWKEVVFHQPGSDP